ncbi:MAG: hypothetical protein J2P49_04335 [Methylocapsa sp.]|nr:hypothetical protein [Methylocapsa sp.]
MNTVMIEPMTISASRTEKQTDADCSADRNHLDVPVLEAAVEVSLRARLHSSGPLDLLKQVLGTDAFPCWGKFTSEALPG